MMLRRINSLLGRQQPASSSSKILPPFVSSVFPAHFPTYIQGRLVREANYCDFGNQVLVKDCMLHSLQLCQGLGCPWLCQDLVHTHNVTHACTHTVTKNSPCTQTIIVTFSERNGEDEQHSSLKVYLALSCLHGFMSFIYIE